MVYKIHEVLLVDSVNSVSRYFVEQYHRSSLKADSARVRARKTFLFQLSIPALEAHSCNVKQSHMKILNWDFVPSASVASARYLILSLFQFYFVHRCKERYGLDRMPSVDI